LTYIDDSSSFQTIKKLALFLLTHTKFQCKPMSALHKMHEELCKPPYF
jgi:hypothetical protein